MARLMVGHETDTVNHVPTGSTEVPPLAVAVISKLRVLLELPLDDVDCFQRLIDPKAEPQELPYRGATEPRGIKAHAPLVMQEVDGRLPSVALFFELSQFVIRHWPLA